MQTKYGVEVKTVELINGRLLSSTAFTLVSWACSKSMEAWRSMRDALVC